MTLRETLRTIASRYEDASKQPLTGHEIASLVRSDLAREIERTLHGRGADFTVKASAGNGNWALVPWAAVFDDFVTSSATRGYYPVYLFDISNRLLFLSLNQGTTTVREEFGSRTPDILTKRAELMRQRVSDYLPRLPVTEIELGSGRLGSDYAAGHVLGVTYSLDALPPLEELQADLHAIVGCYRALTYRGGLDFDVTPKAADKDVEEQRRYRMHKRLERNPKAAKLVREHHGDACQCCGMTFETRYGEIGSGFIEVHHLKPISSLKEGERMSYNIAMDFAVLCANCHRMIHRMADVSDLPGLRARLNP